MIRFLVNLYARLDDEGLSLSTDEAVHAVVGVGAAEGRTAEIVRPSIAFFLLSHPHSQLCYYAISAAGFTHSASSGRRTGRRRKALSAGLTQKTVRPPSES